VISSSDESRNPRKEATEAARQCTYLSDQLTQVKMSTGQRYASRPGLRLLS
jgi:hypothetical protein